MGDYCLENKENKGKTSAKRVSLFLKVTLITLCAMVAVAAALVLYLVKTAKPPAIPEIAAFDGDDEAAFIVPEGHDEDELVGGGLTAPEGFTTDDRKELFYTFLIFGIDGGVSTDTIMVASYDGAAKEAAVISVPRDSLVNVKRNVKKINSAYAVGALHGGGKTGGVEQLKREIKTIIGFSPDFYICVDMKAFIKIIDAVGGVEVDVPVRMKYDDPYQDLHVDIPAGVRTLDGETALKFARYRRGNNGGKTISDYQRIENQQALITALLDKLLRPASILKIPEFIGIFAENVYTDLTMEDMLWFAAQLSEVSGADALAAYTMPTNGTSGEPMWYEYLDGPGIVELVNKTVNPFNKPIQLKDLNIRRD